MLHDKMKIIGDFEPLLMPTSVQGINIHSAAQNNICVRWGPQQDTQPGACAPSASLWTFPDYLFEWDLFYQHLP